MSSGVDAVFNIYDEAGAGLALHGKNQRLLKPAQITDNRPV